MKKLKRSNLSWILMLFFVLILSLKLYETSGMVTVYKGEDLKVEFTLRDENGYIDLAICSQILVLVVNTLSRRVLAKFAKSTSELDETWGEIEILTANEGKFACRLLSEQTLTGENGIYIREIQVVIDNEEFPDGTEKKIIRDDIFDLRDSNSGNL